MSSLDGARLLIVDDDPLIRQVYEGFLEAAGFRVDTCADLHSVREMVASHSYDGVLLDLNLKGEHGFEGLTFLLREAPYTKIFILTSDGTVQMAVEAMRRGASSYLTKDSSHRAIIDELKKHLLSPHEPSAKVSTEAWREALVGESKAIRDLVEKIEKVKDVDSTVLILGESGTGKEVIARAMHKASARANKRFEAVNCGAIPENLLESELFGHTKGAFTDAKADRKGIFEICSEGTLLLDEIGDMPLVLQTKLLRVIQERQIMPVGSSQAVNINTRIIAATHRDLQFEVKSGRFREDLFFRLSVVVVHIPPLRHRIEDIPLLVNYFIDKFNQRFGKSVNRPSAEILARLKSYDWPGNVRELQNTVERGVIFAKGDEVRLEDMFSFSMQDRNESNSESATNLDAAVFEMPLTEAKQAFEKDYLKHHLLKSGGNISEVARRSGRYRADVYRLIDRYGLR